MTGKTNILLKMGFFLNNTINVAVPFISNSKYYTKVMFHLTNVI